jgi:hypothetical protein
MTSLMEADSGVKEAFFRICKDNFPVQFDSYETLTYQNQ